MRLWSKPTILTLLALAGKHETTGPLTWQLGSAKLRRSRPGVPYRGGGNESGKTFEICDISE